MRSSGITLSIEYVILSSSIYPPECKIHYMRTEAGPHLYPNQKAGCLGEWIFKRKRMLPEMETLNLGVKRRQLKVKNYIKLL